MAPSSELVRYLARDHIHKCLQLDFTTTTTSRLLTHQARPLPIILSAETALMYNWCKTMWLLGNHVTHRSKESPVAWGLLSKHSSLPLWFRKQDWTDATFQATEGPWRRRLTNTYTNPPSLGAVVAHFVVLFVVSSCHLWLWAIMLTSSADLAGPRRLLEDGAELAEHMGDRKLPKDPLFHPETCRYNFAFAPPLRLGSRCGDMYLSFEIVSQSSQIKRWRELQILI